MIDVKEENKIITIKNVRGYIDNNQTAYLNLEDVARGLGFTFVATSGNEVIRWNRVDKYLKEFDFGTSAENKYIPENIFYKLCFKAKNKTARKFQDFVTDEVLPSIRQTGGYIVGEEEMTEDELVMKAMQVMQNKLKRLEDKAEKLQTENRMQFQLIGELKPKADYTDRILQNKGLVTTTAIAKDYGMSGKALNKKLHELGIQYKQSNQWFLYSQYQDNGYTHSETIDLTHKDGTDFVKMTTKWTQKGRLFLYNKLKENGIVPVIEQ